MVVKLESTCGDCTVNISVERPGQCRLTTARSSSPCDNGGAYVGVGRSFSIEWLMIARLGETGVAGSVGISVANSGLG